MREPIERIFANFVGATAREANMLHRLSIRLAGEREGAGSSAPDQPSLTWTWPFSIRTGKVLMSQGMGGPRPLPVLISKRPA